MGPKNNGKKGNKARNPNQGRQGIRRPLVSPVSAVRTAVPTTPIPALTVLAAQPDLKAVRAANGEVQTIKKWCFDSTPVYFAPDEPWPSTSLNKGAVVELTGQKQSLSADGIKAAWSEIAYETYDPHAGTQWVTGWVNDAYLDDYNEKFPNSGVAIPNATPNPRDAQQYMILEGKVRYNLCGELCVAFIVKDDIDSVLVKWKTNSPGSYNGILAGGRDNPTSENDLRNMLNAILSEYGYASSDDQLISLRNTLTYPMTPVSLQEDLQKMLTTHYLISGVTINDMGELIGKENPRIKHWVVLDKIKSNGNRVEIYNPFPNKREEYSFAEFYGSCSTNSGIWVKRSKAVSSGRAANAPTFEVAIAHPNPLYRAAQYIDVEGRKKTNLCGEFCVAFVVKESIDAVLEHWKEVQPILYADIVGNNKGTGTFALTTILKSYGYNNEGDVKDFFAGLMDPYLRKSLVSPGRIEKMLDTYYLIAGVNIDGSTGRLKPGNDVRHWVVLDKLSLAGKNRGWVELYNPFPNHWEEYSYREFLTSAGYWSGLWVKREIVPLYVPQVVAGANVEDKPQKDGKIGQWTEGQILDALRRKSRSGKPINKIAAELADLSGWKKRDIISRFKKVILSGKAGVWTEIQLRQEIGKRLKLGKSSGKISAELADKSGWKKRDIVKVLKSELQAQMWSEAQLLDAIGTERQTKKSTNRIAKELAAKSGWKKREVLTRIKRLIEAGKWTEAQLRGEMQKRLNAGKSASKIARELVEPSGWKRWQIGKILKGMRVVEKTAGGKVRRILKEQPVIVVDPSTIVHASKPLDEFVEWQNGLLAMPGSKLRRVKRWGDDDIMIHYGFDVEQVGTTNFQAVGLYNNGNGEFGAISNFLQIPYEDVWKLKAMQIEDEYEAKSKVKDWRKQKMNWLCKARGTIYFYFHHAERGSWETLSYIEWGTLALGGNLVQVDGTEIVQAKMRDGVEREVEVARLKGFCQSDWNRPLDDLLAEGLVHRCFCAYKSNHFGDSPKGIVYSPFYSVTDWEFSGGTSPTALYIPTEWLDPKP